MATATADMEQMLGMTPSEPAPAGIASLPMSPSADMPMMAEEEMPMGGISPEMQQAVEMINSRGRETDRILAHLTPEEIIVPSEVVRNNPQIKEMIFAELRTMGVENPEQYVVGSGANSINPETGIPEFFLKKIRKAISNVGKTVSKAVKTVANVVKKVAPVVLPIALNVMFPGMGAIASGALGSGIGTLIQGGDLKDAFKNALIGGAMGGLAQGVSGGISSLQGGGGFGEGFMGGVKQAGTDFMSNFSTGMPAGAPVPASKAAQIKASAQPVDAVDGVGGDVFSPEARQALTSPTGTPTDPTQALEAVTSGGQTPQLLQRGPASLDYANQAITPPSGSQGSLISFDQAGNVVATDAPLLQTSAPVQTTGSADLFAAGSAPRVSTPIPLDAPPLSQTLPDYKTIGNLENVTLGEPRSYMQQTGDFLFRGGQSPADIAAASQSASQSAVQSELAKYGFTNIADAPAAVQQAAITAGQTAGARAAPGMIARFGPSTALAAGAAYAGGFFDTPPDEPPYQDEQFQQTRYFDMTPEERAKYRVAQLYGTQGSTGPTVVQSDYGMFGYNPYMYYTQPAMFQRPTYAAMGGEMTAYPRMNGSISGPGTETSDDVPAMLSDGEFVMTAKAVRGAGNGSREQGIKTMYDMMSRFEGMVS